MRKQRTGNQKICATTVLLCDLSITLNLSESWFPYKDNNLLGLIRGSDEIMNVKHFVAGSIRQMGNVNMIVPALYTFPEMS